MRTRTHSIQGNCSYACACAPCLAARNEERGRGDVCRCVHAHDHTSHLEMKCVRMQAHVLQVAPAVAHSSASTGETANYTCMHSTRTTGQTYSHPALPSSRARRSTFARTLLLCVDDLVAEQRAEQRAREKPRDNHAPLRPQPSHGLCIGPQERAVHEQGQEMGEVGREPHGVFVQGRRYALPDALACEGCNVRARGAVVGVFILCDAPACSRVMMRGTRCCWSVIQAAGCRHAVGVDEMRGGGSESGVHSRGNLQAPACTMCELSAG